MPFFRMFLREIFGEGSEETGIPNFHYIEPDGPYDGNKEEKISKLVDLTQKSFLAIERELKLTGFWESIPARNKLKADIQQILIAQEFANLPGLVKNRTYIISRIMEIAEKNNDTILYAE